MSEANETRVNPIAVRAAAGQLGAVGEQLASRWSQLTGKINGLNAAAPWGTDEPGKEFNQEYLGGEAPAAMTLQAGDKLVERVRQLGPDVAAAVDGTVEVDDLVGKWFGGNGK